MRSPFTQSRSRASKSTVGASRRQEPGTGFAAAGVYFYVWDDDEGTLASWARELARAERGELFGRRASKRGKERPCHSGDRAVPARGGGGLRAIATEHQSGSEEVEAARLPVRVRGRLGAVGPSPGTPCEPEYAP